MLLVKLTNSNLTLSRETCLITSIPVRKARSGGYVEQWSSGHTLLLVLEEVVGNN